MTVSKVTRNCYIYLKLSVISLKILFRNLSTLCTSFQIVYIFRSKHSKSSNCFEINTWHDGFYKTMTDLLKIIVFNSVAAIVLCHNSLSPEEL